MEALRSSETSVLIRATRRNIPKKAFFIVTAVKTSNLTKHESRQRYSKVDSERHEDALGVEL
jgi:hypothetical protein